jgi:metal-dependent hydrolase (beta-lactamase superfamily II)
MRSLGEVDRVAITTVVDNYIDILRQDEKVARRFSAFAARQVPDLRAEHGLAHFVEIIRGRDITRIAFDFGPSDTALTHNFRVLGLDPGTIDLLALSHGHYDHWGGLGGMLRTYRRARIISSRAGPSGGTIASPWGACTATRSSATTSRWSRCARRCWSPTACC